MRIISGKYRGQQIKGPPGVTTRPTTDRVREAVFNMLGDTPAGISALDLYAGSGAMGLEALSRGAQRCCFVEVSRRACRAIRENVSRLGVDEQKWTICRQRVEEFIPRSPHGDYQLIFADPPYDEGFPHQLVGDLDRWVGRGAPALLVVEFSSRVDSGIVPDACGGDTGRLVADRTYGNSRIVMFRYEKREDAQ